MTSQFRNVWSGRKMRIITVIAAVVLSAVMILANAGVYSRYRKNLIETEEGQLLTMARTIGRSLDQYITQEMEKIDLSLDTALGEGEKASPEDLSRAASLLMEEEEGLYPACICRQGEDILFTLGTWPDEAPALAGELPSRASILDKYQAGSGWYEMLIGRRMDMKGGPCDLVFAMDLSLVHKKIVLPVRIGEGGYSVVKDASLAIIMHHAVSQIGMDALYDRKEAYPDLDLQSLEAWLDLQRKQEEGTGILDSYVWDDPDLTSVRRIVAYTTIDMDGEKWIVNSTLPISELSGPLRRMLLLMSALTLVYLTAIVLILIWVSSAIRREESQKKEISYLKEINRGMEALARKNDEIRHYQRVQSMGMMSSHIAHEFNNYLTPVMVYGELLESDPSVSEDNRQILSEMLRSVNQAAALSRELLDFSRMDAGGKMVLLDLTRETEEAVSVVRQLVPARITFRPEISPDSVWIRGREGMMQHILMNLCKNAFHAMENSEKKELKITYRVEESGSGEERKAFLSVSDTGCGIREESLRDIFEPFYTTKGSSQGTGLGLSVVRTMVENAGGSIEVKSREGEGTSFLMKFEGKKRQEDMYRANKGAGQGRTVCVCRDQKNLAPWKAWLDSLGTRIEYRSHEAAVISRLQEKKHFCDILITENELETMSGIDLAQIVKRTDSGIQVILLTREMTDGQKWYMDNGILDQIRLPDSQDPSDHG